MEVYRVGVAIGMSSNASAVLGVIARDMLGLRGEVGKTEAAMARLKLAMVGVGAVLGGAAILTGMAKLVEHGEKLVHQQALLREGGLSQLEIAQMTAAAWKAASDVIGTSVADNLALVGDLRNRLGDIPKALAALPKFAQIGAVLAAGTGQSAEKAGDQAARFLEQRGSLVNPVTEKIDTARLEQQARLVEAIAAATRFKVGPQELLAFQTTARAAGASLTDQGLRNLVPYIMAGSATRVGTQLSSLEQQLLGGVMTKAAAEFFERAGVLNAAKVHEGRGGHLTIDRHAVRGEELLRQDPASWIATIFRDGLRKGFGDKTVEQQTMEVMRSHLRATVVGLLVEGIRNQAAFQKDASLIQKAQGVDQYQAALEKDPKLKIQALREALDNLMTALGAPMVEPATNALVGITKAVNGLTAWFAGHPDTTRVIMEATAALAGFMVVGGSLQVVTLLLKPFTSALGAFIGVAPGALSKASELIAKLGLLGPAFALAAAGVLFAYDRIKSALEDMGLANDYQKHFEEDIPDKIKHRLEQEKRHKQRDQDKANRARARGQTEYPGDEAPKFGDGSDDFLKPQRESYVTSRGYGVTIPVTLQLDGHTIYKTVVKRMHDAMGATQGGLTAHDGSMGLYPAGLPSGVI